MILCCIHIHTEKNIIHNRRKLYENKNKKQNMYGGGYVSIDGAVDIKLSLDKGKRTYTVKSGTSATNWISVSAYLNGVGSSETKKITKKE